MVWPRWSTRSRELSELGVDWVTVTVPGLARNEVLDRAAALADALDLS